MLNAVLREYKGKFIDTNILTTSLEDKEQNLETLEVIIDNVYAIANDKQKKTLNIIGDFARKILL